MRMACKPFIGAIKAPIGHKYNPEEQSKAPNADLEIDYVFGYRAKDCRNNIKYLKNGNIAYTAAALGIVMDIRTNKQSYFNLHTDDITSFDMHPDGVLIATGEVGAKPKIYVWSSQTFKPLNMFQGVLKRGIALLGFNKSGTKLAASAVDDDHTIAIYDITDKKSKGGCFLLDQKGGRDIMLQMRWKNDDEFVTVGPKVYKLWTYKEEPGKLYLDGKKGRWGKNMDSCTDQLITFDFNLNDCVVGANDGSVQIFNADCLCTSFKKIHSKAVQSITCQNELVITGGNDSKINIMDKTYNLIVIIESHIFKDSICPKIRSIHLSPNNRCLIVGTYGSEIYELVTKDPQIGNNTVFISNKIMHGHYTPNTQWTNEVWGLAVFPNNKEIYATCSDDATVRIWDRKEKKQIKWATLNIDAKGEELPPDEETKDIQQCAKGSCMSISPDGNAIIIGCREGTVRVFNNQLKQTKLFKPSKEEISDIKFSPDGKAIAIGSHDNKIYVYDFPSFKQKCKPLNKHSSYITHLDFSKDGQNLHSTCGAYELLFWDINKGKQLTSGATQLRDEEWNTWTVPIGWPVQGIFRKGYDGTDINAIDRSNFKLNENGEDNYHLLATGDDYAKVSLFKYPTLKKNSSYVDKRAHSSHVTNVKFTKDDKNLISTGGEDQCVIQWNVKKKK